MNDATAILREKGLSSAAPAIQLQLMLLFRCLPLFSLQGISCCLLCSALCLRLRLSDRLLLTCCFVTLRVTHLSLSGKACTQVVW